MTHRALSAVLVATTSCAAASVALTPRPAQAQCASPVAMERVSVQGNGQQTNSCTATNGCGGACKNNSHPALSADGDVVAFDSDSHDILWPSVDNPLHRLQVYARSVSAGTTVMVSCQSHAIGAVPTPGDGCSTFPHVSGDGRYVAFASSAGNLDPDDADTQDDAFVHDLWTSQTWRVSENAAGQDLDGASGDPRLSHDGALVVFTTSATGASPLLEPGSLTPVVMTPGSGLTHVLVKVAATGNYEWISAPASGVQPNGSASQPVISADGRWVAFQSTASNLTLAALDRNGPIADVFVRDRVTGALAAVSVTVTGALRADANCSRPSISADGRYVTFESAASNLLSNRDVGKVVDIFLRDRDTDADGLYDEPGAALTTRISQNALGAGARAGCGYSAISGDGRFVAFTTASTNLDPCDTTAGFLDFFVCDRDVNGDGVFDQPGDTRLSVASENAFGVQANAKCGGNCGVSADGRFAVFNCQADNLIPGDTNGGSPPNTTHEYGRDIFRVQIF